MYAWLTFFASLAGAVLTAVFAPPSAWFAPLWFLAYLVGFIALYFLVFALAAPFLSKKGVPGGANRFAHRMLVEGYGIALFYMQVHCIVTGKEKLPKRGTTFLIVSNHLSNYDHMLMLKKLKHYPIAFISKPENFGIPFVGRYLFRSGFLAIDRENPRNAIGTVNETARRISEGGMCYGVFPEGTRSRTGKLLPFHSGVFLSATKAKCPVVVIRMTDTGKIAHRAPWRPTIVKLEVLETFSSEYVSTHTDAELSARAYALMAGTSEDTPAPVSDPRI